MFPPQLSKWTNLVTGALYSLISILIIITTLGSEWHRFYILYNFLELLVLITIIWQAWRWPESEQG